MNIYETGDKVIINSDLSQGVSGIPENELKKWRGKKTTIMRIGGNQTDCMTSYELDIDKGFYLWDNTWFSPVSE
jgi:hypothetical protein